MQYSSDYNMNYRYYIPAVFYPQNNMVSNFDPVHSAGIYV